MAFLIHCHLTPLLIAYIIKSNPETIKQISFLLNYEVNNSQVQFHNEGMYQHLKRLDDEQQPC